MVLDKVFNIVSNFKFEVGAGIVSLGKLEDKLGSVSKASKDVSNQFKFLFARSALSFTGATGGIIGVLKNAIHTSEEFAKVQQKLAQVLSGNKKHFKTPMKDFNESMLISKGILSSMVGEANKLGVNVDSYMDTFNHFNTLLVPKGAAGDNLEMSKKLALNMMRGSSVLGMHESDVMWQGGSLIEGQANSNQTLFRRLKTETEAFKGVSASQFNAKKPKERVEMLVKGLGQFTDSSQLLETHLKSLTGQMTILTNLFSTAGSILKPLGDLFRKLLVEGLTHLNKFLESKLSKVIAILSKELDGMFGSINDVYESVSKLNSLGKDFSRSKSLAFILYMFIEMKSVLPYVGKALVRFSGILGTVFGFGVGKVVKRLGGLLTVFLRFGTIIGFLARSVLSYLKIGLPILFLIRTLERAKIKAKAADAVYIGNNVDDYTNKMVELKKIYDKMLQPIDYVMNHLSSLFTVFYSITDKLKLFIAVLQGIGLLDEDFEKTDKSMNKVRKSLSSYSLAIVGTYAVIETTFKYLIEYIVHITKEFFKPWIMFYRGLMFIAGLIGKGLFKVVEYFTNAHKKLHAFFGGKPAPKPGFKDNYTDKELKDMHPALRKFITGKKEFVPNETKVVDVYNKIDKDDGNFFTKIIDSYVNNFNKHTSAYKNKYEKVDKSEKARNIINVAKVEIKNQFRENLQPDRVAIAIKDVLTQAVQAPTGTNSRDNTYIGGVGGGFVGG